MMSTDSIITGTIVIRFSWLKLCTCNKVHEFPKICSFYYDFQKFQYSLFCLISAYNKVGDSDILVLPLDVTKFDTHEEAASKVLEHFGQASTSLQNLWNGTH